ncbi:hypothetical protein [Actinophytocola sp.]|uniref:hypothetical protein n=1 Tax=Actinophytocola sp. TaxID=1872138 RepID=UPI002D7FF119|nr:hypothetical protein [Actinophytocola sp.]HET9142155.1 hypothetical protein [Actinophytocola sp.]
MSAPQPPLDELLAQAEQRRAASARLPRIVADTVAVALDERRLVQATTDASGELRALVLHPAAMSFGGKELARMVIEAAHTATEYARQRCLNEVALILGDNATAELEELIGPSPARAAGWDSAPRAAVAPPVAAEPDVRDDDPDDPLSFDPASLRSDR